MSFFLKCYFARLSTNRIWLLLILLGPLIYLIVSLLIDSVSVRQEISLSKDSFLVASMVRPGKPRMMRLDEIISRPDIFFQDSIALVELYSELYPGRKVDRKDSLFISLKETIKRDIIIKSPDKEFVTISYHGNDAKLGQTMVQYYSSCLVAKAKKGRENAVNVPSVLPKWSEDIELLSSMKVERKYTLWKPQRFFPVVWCSLGSMFVVLIFFLIVEATDSSFKSDRDVASYLNLPILGGLPELNNISDILNKKDYS